MSYISVDIDIDDIIWDMSTYDRRRFFERMKSEGYISELCEVTGDGQIAAPKHMELNAKYESHGEFNEALQKLFGNGWRLTKEEEDYIINVSKRFL